MRNVLTCLAIVAATGLAGCALDQRLPEGAQPAYYVAPPPPGSRVCTEYREDMYGRRYCSAFRGT